MLIIPEGHHILCNGHVKREKITLMVISKGKKCLLQDLNVPVNEKQSGILSDLSNRPTSTGLYSSETLLVLELNGLCLLFNGASKM
jgi:hypothetical protein